MKHHRKSRLACSNGPRWVALAASSLLVACQGDQSALHPGGEQASAVAVLFWAMAAGTVIIWLVVMGFVLYAVVGRKRPRSERFADRFTLVGGVAFPTVVLAVLLVFGLALLPGWTEDEEPDLRVHISAEQFWWRVIYELADGGRVETANEIRLPKDATAEFVVTSPDVIHSFWIPALGGKIDAIPGRSNRIRLTATRTGVYRGVCAEFCGASHARMAFDVTVLDAIGFAAWLVAQQQPAGADDAGLAVFISSGCGACHAVRGTIAAGRVGPDLTHVGSRPTIGASTLPNDPTTLLAWLASPDTSKPGVHMPAYAALPAADLAVLVSFLAALR